MSSCSSVPMISWMCLVYYDQARYVLRWHRISYTMYIASVRIEIHGQDIRYKYRALYATPSTLSNKISSYPTHPSSRVCVTLGLSDPAVFENGLQYPQTLTLCWSTRICNKLNPFLGEMVRYCPIIGYFNLRASWIWLSAFSGTGRETKCGCPKGELLWKIAVKGQLAWLPYLKMK